MNIARAIAAERQAGGSILDHLATLADPLRCRMLLVLERHELTVSELCVVLQLPQSTVSRHLKTLADAQWVRSRRDGTSRFYSMSLGDLDGGARRLWPLIREQVATTSGVEHDERRLSRVLARRRLKHRDNVDVRRGTLEALPVDNGHLDIAMLALVLHHVADPALALTEAARVVRPGGRIQIIDMLPHDREDYQQQMGHVWLGFPEDQMRKMLTTAGFDHVRVCALPINDEAKGPALFAATATKA